MSAEVAGKEPAEPRGPLIEATVHLQGEGDRILPASSVEYFRTHLRNGTVETIPHCGHLPMVESSRFVAARIARFLAEL